MASLVGRCRGVRRALADGGRAQAGAKPDVPVGQGWTSAQDTASAEPSSGRRTTTETAGQRAGERLPLRRCRDRPQSGTAPRPRESSRILASDALDRSGSRSSSSSSTCRSVDLCPCRLEASLLFDDIGVEPLATRIPSTRRRRSDSPAVRRSRPGTTRRFSPDATVDPAPTRRCASRGQPQSPRPGYRAAAPSCSSMRRSWLYFATRSVRLALPVLI